MAHEILTLDFQKYNLFRKPDWRFQRILQIHGGGRRCTRRDDVYVRRFYAFYSLWDAAQNDDAAMERLFYRQPALYYAWRLHQRAIQQDEPEAVLFIQSRLLARQSYQEIAAVSGILPQAVEFYEAMFFNVCPYLDHRDWITKQVLIPGLTRQGLGLAPQPAYQGVPSAETQLITPARAVCDESLKMFAYFGGPHICEFMIHGHRTGAYCANQDDLAGWFDRDFSDTIRARSAQAARAFEINRYNVMELFATYTRILEIEKSEDTLASKATQMERALHAFVAELPWRVGPPPSEEEQPVLLEYRVGNAELRDDEAMRVAAGEEVGGLEELEGIAIGRPAAK